MTLFSWLVLIGGVITLITLPGWFHHVEAWIAARARGRLPRVERIGYVEGRPDEVICADCESQCGRFRSVYRNEGSGRYVLYTKFICPKCLGRNH